MTPFDDELARALARVPVGDYAPITEVQARARQLRTRRRLAGAGLALAAAVLVAVPSALALGGDGDLPAPAPPVDTPSPSPSPSPSPTDGFVADCPVLYGDRLDQLRPVDALVDVADPSGLPAPVRLLWDEDAAPAPVQAFATDNRQEAAEVAAAFDHCPAVQDLSALVVQTSDGVVERTALIRAVGGRAELSLGGPEPGYRHTLDAGSTVIHVEYPLEPGSGFRAEWEDANGMIWQVSASTVTDAELVELVETMRVEDGVIDVSRWSVAQTGQVVQPAGGEDESVLIAQAMTDADPWLRLTVSENDAAIWLSATPGGRVVDVGGATGLVSEYDDGTASVAWQPEPGILAWLYGDVGTDELLAIAESVEPVPADDQRLAGVWTTSDG